MCNNFYKRFSFVFLICVATVGQLGLVTASSSYSVRAIIPHNQVDKNQSYFDLRLSPGEKQTIQIVVDNSENGDIISKAALSPASTGRNGLIVYNQPEARDPSLEVSIAEIAKISNPQNTIPAKGSATVNIDIQMPDKPFDGVILGGIVFTAEKTSENQTNEAGITLNNEYSYVVGLKITQTDAVIEPDFKLNSITPGLVNHRNAVVINISNIRPLIAKGMEAEAEIYKKDSTEVFRSLSLSYAEMAPNSNGDYVVDWRSNTLDPGTYRLRMVVKYQSREWVWDEEFTISAGEASHANSNAVDLPARNNWIYAPLALAIILIALFAYFLGKRRSKKEEK